MINKEKWINSLPNNNSKQLNHEFNQVDNERWERTISKNNEQENNYKWENTVLIEKKYSALKKYSLISALLCSLNSSCFPLHILQTNTSNASLKVTSAGLS